MPILKHHHTESFAIIPNAVLEDSRLSLKEKGLLTLLLSLPEDWDVSISGLITRFHLQEGSSAVTSGFHKLQETGYMKQECVHTSGGRFKTMWYVSDRPVYAEDASALSPLPGEPAAVEPVPEGPAAEQPPAADCPPTKTESTKTKETRKEKAASQPFSPPSYDEVKAYCRERRNHVDASAFLDYYESNGWKVGRNRMSNWRAAVRTWEKKDREFASARRKGPERPDVELPPTLHLETNEEGDRVWML